MEGGSGRGLAEEQLHLLLRAKRGERSSTKGRRIHVTPAPVTPGGNIGQQTVRAVVARPDMALVGVYAYSADKRGRDAADVCRLDEPTGVAATGDIEALLPLAPDCFVSAPLRPATGRAQEPQA